MQRGRAAGPLAKMVLYYNTHLADILKPGIVGRYGHLQTGASGVMLVSGITMLSAIEVPVMCRDGAA